MVSLFALIREAAWQKQQFRLCVMRRVGLRLLPVLVPKGVLKVCMKYAKDIFLSMEFFKFSKFQESFVYSL